MGNHFNYVGGGGGGDLGLGFLWTGLHLLYIAKSFLKIIWKEGKFCNCWTGIASAVYSCLGCAFSPEQFKKTEQLLRFFPLIRNLPIPSLLNLSFLFREFIYLTFEVKGNGS